MRSAKAEREMAAKEMAESGTTTAKEKAGRKVSGRLDKAAGPWKTRATRQCMLQYMTLTSWRPISCMCCTALAGSNAEATFG